MSRTMEAPAGEVVDRGVGPAPVEGTFSTNLVARVARFLDTRLTRRSVLVRSAFAGSALSVAGVDFLTRPGTAYGAICACGNLDCDCGSTCCSGFSEFCCSVNYGYNYCPTGTIMGGWWKADGSVYCDGPRYYMDCNAVCDCGSGCGGGFSFCTPGCDGKACTCAYNDCGSYLTSCLQFRYGQCNQDVPCIGRIVCRVVACIPPWEVDPTCTTTLAVDDFTANMNAPCNTSVPAPPPPPPPPPPPCYSPATRCEVVGMTPTTDEKGYLIVTAFGKVFPYGHAPSRGDASNQHLNAPMVGMAASGGGYWLVGSDGGIFTFGDAAFYGSMGGQHLNQPVVGMAATPTRQGYWLVAADGGIFNFGDAAFYGSMGAHHLNQPVVGMAPTATGDGYWLVAADGGIFNFGDAGFHGSAGATKLNRPVVGMAAGPAGTGYWLVAQDGGVFAYDAAFYGSAA